jgi:hypothetical protein
MKSEHTLQHRGGVMADESPMHDGARFIWRDKDITKLGDLGDALCRLESGDWIGAAMTPSHPRESNEIRFDDPNTLAHLPRPWSEPYSPLAWELAQRGELEATDGGGVRAVVRTRIQNGKHTGIGGTSTEAMQNLARVLDSWVARLRGESGD